MISFIANQFQLLMKFLTDLFTGQLPGYHYSLSAVLIILAIGTAIYEVLFKHSSKGYITNITLEILSQFALWMLAIILLKILNDLNGQHYERVLLYTFGLLVTVTCSIVLIILILLKNFHTRQDHLEILSFLIGGALGYCMVQVFKSYNLISTELNDSTIIILCILCGGLTLIYQFGQREQFQNKGEAVEP